MRWGALSGGCVFLLNFSSQEDMITVMPELTSFQLALIVALVGSLLISAIRVARMARQHGRNPRLWFFITLFLTAIPATIVFWRDHLRRISGKNSLPSFRERLTDRSATEPLEEEPHIDVRVSRCPHCGGVYETTDETPEPVSTCPKCHMSIKEGFFA